MDIRAYNRRAWDAQVARGNEWTIPVSPDEIANARAGEWEVLLTPKRAVPREWFPPLAGLPTLCLGGGGGQQGPILAAAGAQVTVLDNSPRQLEQDRRVAERDGLDLRAVEGDMANLHEFGDERFGLVFHPVSNCFVPDVLPVWREAYRVLSPGGVLLAGFCNPALYIFDDERLSRGELEVRHALPYSDLTSLTDEERARYVEADEPLNFGHTLEAQIGGQIAAGFAITGLYEDRSRRGSEDPLSAYMPTFIATRAERG